MRYVADALAETVCIIAALLPSHTSHRILSALTGSSTTSLSTFATSFTWALFTVIAIVGGFLRLSAYRQLGRHFTFEFAMLKDHKLITTGPFSIVRHPSYTCALALFGGSSLAVVAPGRLTRYILVDGAIRDGHRMPARSE
jgi:protein-S-isoprenylcysteine O-methyltransferase Ste14